ncbi:hypothetical protein Taro_022685 [Colocasia esculenta]|uniref:Uncharacterized protein n=1 Tax=Colocasia esculenta TaxID=4460 RepID=A0A843VC59_COLES|nr:hypothetical protein [Colocasia esculenta]
MEIGSSLVPNRTGIPNFHAVGWVYLAFSNKWSERGFSGERDFLNPEDMGDDVELSASNDESVEALSLSKENEVEEVDPEQPKIQLGDSDEEEYISDQNEYDNEDVNAEFHISPTSEDEMENLKIWFEDDMGLLQVGGERVVGGDLLPFLHLYHRPLHRYHRQTHDLCTATTGSRYICHV